METLKNYMAIEWWTLIVAVATLIVSILAYCYARKSNKRSLRGLIASKEAQLKAMESSMSFGIDASQMGTLLTQKSMLQAEIEQLKKQL